MTSDARSRLGLLTELLSPVMTIHQAHWEEQYRHDRHIDRIFEGKSQKRRTRTPSQLLGMQSASKHRATSRQVVAPSRSSDPTAC